VAVLAVQEEAIIECGRIFGVAVERWPIRAVVGFNERKRHANSLCDGAKLDGG
jgi:hypothetical protein